MCKAVLTVLVLCAGMAISDTGNAYVFTDGRGAMPIRSELIAMEAESVIIIPDPSSTHPYSPCMNVECVFYLRNLTDRPLYETVFFPFESFYSTTGMRMNYEAGDDERSEAYYSRTVEMMESDAGRAVKAEEMVPEWLQFRAYTEDEDYEISYLRGEVNQEMRLVFWPVMACWDMHFEPGETIRLVNTYNTFWKFNQYFGGTASLTYVTRSGATWAGVIGDAVISITVPERFSASGMEHDNVYWQWSGSPVREGNSLTWHYTDWEPEEDITLTASWEPGSLINMIYYGGYPHMRDSLVANWRSGELYPVALDAISASGDFLSAEHVVSYLDRWGRIMCGLSEPDSNVYFDRLFDPDGPNCDEPRPHLDPDIMEVPIELADRLAECRRTVESADMEFLLPMVMLRRFPEERNMEMYGAVPRQQIAYLLYLENVRDAVCGNTIVDPALESLFRLSGWYIAGEESPMLRGDISEIISRERVNEFWRNGGGCAMPLVSSTSFEERSSNAQEFFIKASSQLSEEGRMEFFCSNLADGDEGTSWITGSEGFGHGESLYLSVREAKLLPGFSVINGRQIGTG